MDANKICFITCVTDEEKYKECRKYIASLIVPKGITIDGRAVYGAKSLTTGYQGVMESCRFPSRSALVRPLVQHIRRRKFGTA